MTDGSEPAQPASPQPLAPSGLVFAGTGWLKKAKFGVSEARAGFLIEPSMKSMFSFALLIVVLVLRPRGLMGRRA